MNEIRNETPHTNKLKGASRYAIIDQIRGVAIVLMVFFHLFFDLKMFGAVSINFSKDPFWYFIPRLIVFLFLIAVGLSLALVHSAFLPLRIS